MKWPRYEVHSITGYSTTGVPGEGKLSTTWWVADTWNCYRECLLTAVLSGSDDEYTGKRIAQRRSQAERNCARLNRETDEWLASSVDPTLPSV